MRILLCTLLVALLTSCATAVTSIKVDQDKPLTANTGYLIIGVDTNKDLRAIDIKGPIDIVLRGEDIRKDSRFILTDLPSGTYRIDKIRFNRYVHLDLEEEAEQWTFTVSDGQISYVGHLEVLSAGSWYFVWSDVELVNRTSEALQYLEESFPNILANRDLVYDGVGEDHFLKYVSSLESPQTTNATGEGAAQ